jgi:Lamin Tail Domain/Secretion system C-terminal sorting domain
VNKVPPSISEVAYLADNTQWQQPTDNQKVTIRTTVNSTTGLDHVTLFYSTELYGNFTKVTMFDDGAHGDVAANDNIFGAIIPGQIAGTWVRFYIEAAAADAKKTMAFSPVGAEHDVFIYHVAPLVSSSLDIVINEVMAINQTTVVDENGEHEDWIELYNKSTQSVDVSGYHITDNPDNLNKWKIPAGTMLAANDYLILWADEDSAQGPLHCNFKLAATGETLYLFDKNLALVDSVIFGQQLADKGYARFPNGTGPFVVKSHTFDANNDVPLDAKELDFENNIAIFPNPAHEAVDITFSQKPTNLLEIFNILGQKMLETKANLNNHVVLNGWDTGVYLVKCGAVSRRFIVE